MAFPGLTKLLKRVTPYTDIGSFRGDKSLEAPEIPCHQYYIDLIEFLYSFIPNGLIIIARLSVIILYLYITFNTLFTDSK